MDHTHQQLSLDTRLWDASPLTGTASGTSLVLPSGVTVIGSRERVAAVEQVAHERDCVLSRAEIMSAGGTAWDIERELERGRWSRVGRHTIAIHRGPLTERALQRVALHEVGSHGALDGVSGLRAAGLVGFESPVCVSVLHGWQPTRIPGVCVKELRRWDEADVIDAGMRRVHPALAAVRAASWEDTDRQAALILIMAAQQRVARAEDMREHLLGFKRLKRRAVIRGVLTDIVDGVQAMGELDFATLCRRRGLPEPSRQVIRRGPRGRVYLDVCFDDFGVIVEIEGAHHDSTLNAIDDALRQNHLSTSDAFLRIPVTGLRLHPDMFMDQVERLLVARGWRRDRPHIRCG